MSPHLNTTRQNVIRQSKMPMKKCSGQSRSRIDGGKWRKSPISEWMDDTFPYPCHGLLLNMHNTHTHIHTYAIALVLTFDFCWLWFHHRWTFFPVGCVAADAAVAVACAGADGYHVSRHCLLSPLHSFA